jgi:hypothetical protein
MTHSGEEWFQIGWQQYAVLGTLVLVYLVLVFGNKLPAMKSFQEFTDTINSAGGHIIILSIFSGWFFLTAMRFFFHVLGLPDEVVTKNNAVIMTAIAFLTGTAFGGAWGALIKTMSGGKANGGTPGGPDTLTPTLTPEIPAPMVGVRAIPTGEQK